MKRIQIFCLMLVSILVFSGCSNRAGSTTVSEETTDQDTAASDFIKNAQSQSAKLSNKIMMPLTKVISKNVSQKRSQQLQEVQPFKFSADSYDMLPMGEVAEYTIQGATVFYGKTPRKDIDTESFQVLNKYYAKDKESGLVIGKRILGSDGDAFVYISDFYTKDKNFVYYGGARIENADTQSFQVLDRGFAKDKNYVYNSGEKLNIEKSTEYQVLNNSYGKDDMYAYFMGKIIERADQKSFEVMKMQFHAKDKNNAFFENTIILDSDPQTFEELDFTYSKDKNFVYRDEKKIEGADPKSFKALNADYSKDSYNAFYEVTKIVDADVETFEANEWKDANENINLGKIRFAKDKNTRYESGKPFNDVGKVE